MSTYRKLTAEEKAGITKQLSNFDIDDAIEIAVCVMGATVCGNCAPEQRRPVLNQLVERMLMLGALTDATVAQRRETDRTH